ncbi:MAG: flippase-like domain-containing protein [Actinomycetota bacterium]|nr:flippase-like domain-containing protein [Actinomycetota bacterium]
MRVVGLIVSAVFLAAVVWWASRQEAPSFPADVAGWLAIAAGVGVYALATVLRGERWLALLTEGGERAPRSDAHGLTWVGMMGNAVLPARGGDALRVFYMSRRARRSLRDIAGSLIAERLLDVVVLVSVYSILAVIVLEDAPAPDLPDGPVLALVVAGLIAAFALLAYMLHRVHALERIRSLVAPFAVATRRLHGRHGLVMLALTIAIWTLEAGNLMLIAAAIDFSLNPGGALFVIGLGGIFLLVPSGPGHAGTFDAAVLLGAGTAGASAPVALSFLLMARLVIFVPPAIVGLALVLSRYNSLRQGRAAEAGP